ncbi:DUF3014 domain-containing protein [Methyloversatilis thermotolerans]|uniref:DUF3014 domain-containing protein n=1 Tax=Methyloversatilis thermotolerans TaxID=1346290 RepID=UPI00036FC5F4|nr:DUF3014 domain-containing protein [Methyloversatilis thermotolerans]
MKKSTAVISVLIALAIAVGGYLFYVQPPAAPPPAELPADPPPVATLPESPSPAPDVAPHYPIDVPAAADAPAAEADLDARLLIALRALFGASLDTMFNTTDIVRRIVVTVDNLPRERVSRRLMPVKPVPGPMVIAGSGDERVIDASNAERYRPYVELMERVPTATLVDAYVRNYDAFQARYVELGYPQGYFNNRLVEVIDHLLATPEPAVPLRVAQPRVLYTFADPELEKLSEGRKILLRMGPDNAAKVKARLRDIRAAVTREAAAGTPSAGAR